MEFIPQSIRIYIFLLTFFMCSVSYSQEPQFNTDSVVVHFIPWETETYLALDPPEVREFAPSFLHHKITLTDSTALAALATCLYSEQLHESNTPTLDVRMVIDLYSGGGIISTIAMDGFGYFRYQGAVYSRNKKLLNWITLYVTTGPK